jgi:hypothetical protein
MPEKQPFFYKETPKGQRLDLSKDYINSLLGDVSVAAILPQPRVK